MCNREVIPLFRVDAIELVVDEIDDRDKKDQLNEKEDYRLFFVSFKQ